MSNKRILITGVTGTLGTTVTQILLAAGHEVIGYSRDEQKQSKLPKHERLTLYVGDVRDRDRLVEASRKVDLILHFASLKMVDVLEENPEEAVATIVLGTQNVLHAQRANGIPRVVFTSTDKATYPVNVYGACKLAAERLVLRNPHNAVCRYGNVVGSRGSVVPDFVRLLRAGEDIKITDPRMTRFWIRIEDAAAFVLEVALTPARGGLNVPNMRAASVVQLASCLADEMGIDDLHYDVVGCRPGEKLHECLTTEFEGDKGSICSETAPRFTDRELRELIRPVVQELTK